MAQDAEEPPGQRRALAEVVRATGVVAGAMEEGADGGRSGGGSGGPPPCCRRAWSGPGEPGARQTRAGLAMTRLSQSGVLEKGPPLETIARERGRRARRALEQLEEGRTQAEGSNESEKTAERAGSRGGDRSSGGEEMPRIPDLSDPRYWTKWGGFLYHEEARRERSEAPKPPSG